jgi:hypothetical protein
VRPKSSAASSRGISPGYKIASSTAPALDGQQVHVRLFFGPEANPGAQAIRLHESFQAT